MFRFRSVILSHRCSIAFLLFVFPSLCRFDALLLSFVRTVALSSFSSVLFSLCPLLPCRIALSWCHFVIFGSVIHSFCRLLSCFSDALTLLFLSFGHTVSFSVTLLLRSFLAMFFVALSCWHLSVCRCVSCHFVTCGSVIMSIFRVVCPMLCGFVPFSHCRWEFIFLPKSIFYVHSLNNL